MFVSLSKQYSSAKNLGNASQKLGRLDKLIALLRQDLTQGFCRGWYDSLPVENRPVVYQPIIWDGAYPFALGSARGFPVYSSMVTDDKGSSRRLR